MIHPHISLFIHKGLDLRVVFVWHNDQDYFRKFRAVAPAVSFDRVS